MEEELEAGCEYKEYEKMEEEIESMLLKLIPEEHRKLLVDYNDVSISFRTLYRDFFYKQGFIDSLLLAEILLKS